jgi:hypothetical protein
MIDNTQLALLMGASVIGIDGERIGAAGQFYLDNATGDPVWVTVHTGLFGLAESFVPLADATTDGENLWVGYSQEIVKDAPRIHTNDGLSTDEETDLYRYYDLQTSRGGADIGTDESTEMRDVDRDAVRHAPTLEVGNRDTTLGWKPVDDPEVRSAARLRKFSPPNPGAS